MPAFPPVPGVLRIRMLWGTGGTLPVSTTLHFNYSGGPPSVADCLTIANDVSTQASSHLASLLSSAYELFEVEVTDLTTTSGNQNTGTTAVVGTRSGAAAPQSVCAVSKHTILRRYRGGKPKNFFPFGTDTDITNERTWSSAFTTAMDAGVTAFVNGVSGITVGSTSLINFVNVSYYAGFTSVQNPLTLRWRNVPKLRTTPVVDVISASVTDAKLGTQKRRLNS